MIKRLFAILAIYLCTCIAWGILGATVLSRTHGFDSSLRDSVAQLWGNVQTQEQPTLSYSQPRLVTTKKEENGRVTNETTTQWDILSLPIAGSDIHVKLALEHRQKGLLWYATYRVVFDGTYTVVNSTAEAHDVTFGYKFPGASSVYDEFKLAVGGKERKQLDLGEGSVTATFPLKAGQKETVTVHYATQGLDTWWYDFGDRVHQVRDFKLTMDTDFDKIDYPANAIAATTKEKTPTGWQLTWRYTNLLTSVKIGMAMPQHLNPGPWVSQVIFSAPISLFLFLFLIFVITSLRQIRLHPMHYFFLSAAFFSFHLMLAYLVDHTSVEVAVAVASVVSVFLAVSYMRLVVGNRFAFVEVALAQGVYLVLFSCTFFLEGFTGLSITILTVATLFVVMQMTGRLDWEEVFKK
jgi:inner membrane protein involved in colicin E2 resistance